MEYLPKIINSVGLISDIIGALLIWKYGLPEPISKAGTIYLTAGVDDNEKKLAQSYQFFARLGLGLLIGGFLLQLISNFVPPITK